MEEVKEQLVAGSSVLSVLSLANCAAGAASRHLPLYKHDASLLSPSGRNIIIRGALTLNVSGERLA